MKFSAWAGYAIAFGTFSVLIILIYLLAFSPAIPSSPATQQSPPQVRVSSPTIPPNVHIAGTLVHQANFGSWSYYAQVGKQLVGSVGDVQIKDGQLYVWVQFDKSSPTTIKPYIVANKSLLNQVINAGGSDEIYIVFNDYVPVAQFRRWIAAHHLTTGTSWMRAVDETSNPKRYIMMVANQRPDGKTIISDSDVEEQMNFVQQSNPNAELKGVFATHAWADASELQAIASDPSVLYVDVTPDVVRQDLAAAKIQGGQEAAVVVDAFYVFSTVEQVDNTILTPTPSSIPPTPIPTLGDGG